MPNKTTVGCKFTGMAENKLKSSHGANNSYAAVFRWIPAISFNKINGFTFSAKQPGTFQSRVSPEESLDSCLNDSSGSDDDDPPNPGYDGSSGENVDDRCSDED